MHKWSFVAGLAVGAVGMLLATFALPGLVPGRVDATEPEARPAPPPEQPRVEREHRVVTGGPARNEEIAFLFEDEGKEPDAKEEGGSLWEARLNARETAAIATLRNIVSAQAQFQSTACADENDDGVGEHGSFGELSGEVPVRGGERLQPPVLSNAFRKISGGRVERNGYYYRIFLPRAGDGTPLAERDKGGYAAGAVEADVAEVAWCAYAWPKEKGVTGTRTFFVNQEGDVIATSEGKYSGDSAPAALAAFEPQGSGLTGEVAVDARGHDGLSWKQAGLSARFCARCNRHPMLRAPTSQVAAGE